MREKWIDNAKGLAMLMVIYAHCSHVFDDYRKMGWFFGVHLVVFILLSGYTFKKKDLTGEYIGNKFSRLMVPYFITCACVTVMDIVNSAIFDGDKTFLTAGRIAYRDLVAAFYASGASTEFYDINYTKIIGAIWFLPALFFGIIIFQYLLNKIDNDFKLGAVTASLAALSYVSGRYIWFPFSIQSGMMATFFLWIGYEVKKYEILKKVKWYHYILALIILAFGIYYDYSDIGFVTSNMRDPLISIVVGLSGALLVYFISKINKYGKVLEYFGRISLTMLCTHLFTLSTLTIHIKTLLNGMNLTDEVWYEYYVALEVFISIILAVVVELLKKIIVPVQREGIAILDHGVDERRNVSIDIVKGICIVLMLVGHFDVDYGLRNIIFSCHMMAFVIFSGYFYREKRKFSKTFISLCKSFLIPYAIFILINVLLSYEKWNAGYFKRVGIKYLLGLSFGKGIFADYPSIGPFYFVLMLFGVRLIYLVLEMIFKNEKARTAAVFVLSIAGYMLGTSKHWLPWSFDISLYALAFYQIGIWLKKYKIIEMLNKNAVFYFALVCVWAHMIHKGAMEIAIRYYGNYGLVVLGATAGTLCIYLLSRYIQNNLPLLREILKYSGEYSIIILVIHSSLNGYIGAFVEKFFTEGNIPAVIIRIAIQIAMAIIIGRLIAVLKKISKRKNTNKKLIAG